MATINLTEDCLRARPVTDSWTVKLRLGLPVTLGYPLNDRPIGARG